MVMIFYMMGEKWSTGEAQLKAGQHKEAIVNFTRAIESTPKLGSDDLAKAYYNRGVSELASGATEAAHADFRKSIEVDPTPVDAQGFKTRGLAKSALGDKQGAKADFIRAGSYGDNSVEEEIQYPYDVVRQDVMRYMIRSL